MTNRYHHIEQLFKAHYAQMHRLAVALLHNDDLARDTVHDVFASMLDSRFDTLPSVGYLMKGVRNRCLNVIRNSELRQRIANRYFIDIEEYESESWPDEDTISAIYGAIESDLTPQAKRVMELRFADGLKCAEVAKVMDISETAVYRHLRHALIIIRQKLNQNGQI